MLRLDGKVALVTGCGTVGEGWGNGKAIAVLLARQGASVYGCDLNEEAAHATRKLIEAEGGVAQVQVCNVTRSAEVKALVDACIARFGRIDILINNVGRSEPGDPVTMDEDVWDEQMDVNLKSAFLACKHVLPVMERQGGARWSTSRRSRGCATSAPDGATAARSRCTLPKKAHASSPSTRT